MKKEFIKRGWAGVGGERGRKAGGRKRV